MTEWKTIDSAPEDYILAYNEEWYHPEVLDWRDFGECFQPCGWRDKPWPTHWMPLPNPPKSE